MREAGAGEWVIVLATATRLRLDTSPCRHGGARLYPRVAS